MRIVLPLLSLALLVACRPAEIEEHHDHDEAPAPAVAAEEIEVPLAGIRGLTILAAPEPRAEGAWFPGEAIADPASEAILTSPVSGIVAEAPSLPGRPVRSGAVLLVVESPELADLVARRSVAVAETARAEAALAREEALLRDGATSASEVESARRDAGAARAEEEAARLALAARGVEPAHATARYVVTAPAAGSVVSWRVKRGEGIAAGATLGEFQGAAAGLARVEIPLPGPDWRIGDATEVRSSDGLRWPARIVSLPPRLDDATRRLTYRLALEGAPPIPGKPLEVRVPFASGVILPQSAVQQVEGVWGVFRSDGEHAHFRPVRRGIELGADVMILEGVSPGDEVVADGAYLLKSRWLAARGGGDAHEH